MCSERVGTFKMFLFKLSIRGRHTFNPLLLWVPLSFILLKFFLDVLNFLQYLI